MTREEALAVITFIPEEAFTIEIGEDALPGDDEDDLGRTPNANDLLGRLHRAFPEFHWRLILDRSGQWTRWALTIDDDDPRERMPDDHDDDTMDAVQYDDDDAVDAEDPVVAALRADGGPAAAAVLDDYLTDHPNRQLVPGRAHHPLCREGDTHGDCWCFNAEMVVVRGDRRYGLHRTEPLTTTDIAARYANATHRCKTCGALWRLNPSDPAAPSGSPLRLETWSCLTLETMGQCCDNVEMGDQIEALDLTGGTAERKVTLSGRPPELGAGEVRAPGPIDPATGMHTDYWVLSEEDRAKGFVRPVRLSYRHVGTRPRHPVRPLTAEEQERYKKENYVSFEQYPEGESPVTGRFWTMAQLRSGCGTVTTMNRAIAETYSRSPAFYGSTYCAACRDHFPVGEHGEFVWVDENGITTDQKVGT